MSAMKKYACGGIVLSFLLALALPIACTEIPAEEAKVNGWFSQTITPFSSRKGLDPNLVTAESSAKVLKVRKDGSGEFRTVQAAIDSVKVQNTIRTIIDIGAGEYKEKIKVERFKPYITFRGDPKNKPTLVFNGNSEKYGTVDSASVIIESDYFVASNIIFKNTSPRPDGKMKGAQAVALRVSGEKSAFYNCRLIGFQDTLCDDAGKHFFKDCYIEGTVDFIFGDAQSMYLNCEIHVIPGDPMTIITAQARKNNQDPGTYVIVHGKVTGSGRTSVLGRSWMPAAKVLYLYTTLSDTVEPAGWSDNRHPETDKTVYFSEFECKGPGSDRSKRVPFEKKLTAADVKPFLTLDYIEATKWLLPPPS
ncbi:hypothetical protein V2J09_002383 [Rumex salicifolius]